MGYQLHQNPSEPQRTEVTIRSAINGFRLLVSLIFVCAATCGAVLSWQFAMSTDTVDGLVILVVAGFSIAALVSVWNLLDQLWGEERLVLEAASLRIKSYLFFPWRNRDFVRADCDMFAVETQVHTSRTRDGVPGGRWTTHNLVFLCGRTRVKFGKRLSNAECKALLNELIDRGLLNRKQLADQV